MLQCVLSPFVGKNGVPLASIVPHLTQAFGDDSTVEILLRPRMPLVPASISEYAADPYQEGLDQDEEMDMPLSTAKSNENQDTNVYTEPMVSSSSIFKAERVSAAGSSALETHISATTTQAAPEVQPMSTNQRAPVVPSSAFMPVAAQQTSVVAQDTEMAEGSDDSSDAESVHLTMQLDSESESEEENP
jgi:hypothetical protein